jgi:hypothetical protein
VDQGNQILLNVTAFELEHHSSCNYDYLEIRFTMHILYEKKNDLNFILEMEVIHLPR